MSKRKDKPSIKKSQVTKFTSKEEIRNFVRELATTIEPESVFNEMKKCLNQRKSSDEILRAAEKATLAISHEKHLLVAESLSDEYWRTMVIDLAQCIEKEYACTANSEIALAGLAAASYYRYLRVSRAINDHVEQNVLTEQNAQIFGHLSKEADRAYRQYVSAMETLRSRRQPCINVNIQTKSAFFNENQTINNNTPPHAARINDSQ